MLRSLLAACVLYSFAPSALAAQADDAAWLVPADATVLVRLESAQSWNALVRALAPLAGEAAAQHDLQTVLDAMASAPAGGARAAPPRLDPARPLYLAIQLAPAAPLPVFTLVAPVTNGQPFRFQPQLGRTTSVVRGAYTGVSNRAGYAASSAPNPRLAALRPGLASVHVDLAALIAAYRPFIDMGLAQFEAMLEQAPKEDEAPLDLSALMEVYLAAARALVDSAESLELALARRGDKLGLRFDYLQRQGRAGTPAVADVTALLGLVDPASSIQMALNGKASDYFALFEDFTDAVVEIYPEPLRTDVRRLLGAVDELDELFLPGVAVGFDAGMQGIHATYAVRSPRPVELQARLEALLRELDHEGGLLRVGEAEQLSGTKLAARVLPLAIQHEAMLAALSDMSAASGGIAPEAEQEFRTTMEALYGRDLRLALVPEGERLVLLLAGDDGELRADLARLEAAPTASMPELRALLAEIEPGALGFAYRLDFGRWLGRTFAALQGVASAPGVTFPDQPAPFGFWGSTLGRKWSGGMTLKLSELIAFAKAIQGLGSQ